MGASPNPAPNSEEKSQDRVSITTPPQEAALPGSAPGPLGPVCGHDSGHHGRSSDGNRLEKARPAAYLSPGGCALGTRGPI